MKNHLTTASLNVWRLISFKSSWHTGLRERHRLRPNRDDRDRRLFCISADRKFQTNGGEEQQQSRWQRRRSQADNVLPRLPQGPRLRRSVLVWVGSRPGLLGSAVLAVVPASSAVSQLLWTSVPGLTLTPALVCTVQWQLDVRGH